MTPYPAIAIYGRQFNDTVIPFVEELFDYLESRKIKTYIHCNFLPFLQKQIRHIAPHPTFQHVKELPEVAFMLSLGGDGTMLSAVSIVQDSGIPIAGINFGRLGFLANIEKTKISSSLNQIFEGEYALQSRTLLSITSQESALFKKDNFALNDITVFRHENSSMITVDVKINGELLNSYWADGIIIATPTGSTAYSLSCGGPIIMPGSGNFVITPVAPHNLNVRPIVVSSDMELEVEVKSRSSQYILSCDSKHTTLPTTAKLKIKEAPFKINLIRLKNTSYFKTLQQKLLWGLDVRNY
ncbi:MAG TPA: NAD kinase [Sphingobacterium sp.]|nr:NAD kinase [Sphingobacterium sp.]